MKILVTESQEEFLSFIRRLKSPEIINHMSEIINEGFWHYKPCDYQTPEEYLNIIMRDSAMTLVYSYIMNTRKMGKSEEELIEYVKDIMKPKFVKSILEHYNWTREDEEC